MFGPTFVTQAMAFAIDAAREEVIRLVSHDPEMEACFATETDRKHFIERLREKLACTS